MSLRITCISDSHGCHDDLRLGSGDLLIHAGDFSPSEKVKPKSYKVSKFEDWVKWQNYSDVVLVNGNHDEDQEASERLKSLGVTVLTDEATYVGGLKIWGSPWSPRHKPGRPQSAWKFDANTEFGRRNRSKIPLDIDILVSHCPMFGTLDLTDKGEHIGCKELLYRVLQMEKLRLVCHGHVHEAGGCTSVYINGNQCSIINASGSPAEQRAYGFTPQPVYNITLDRSGSSY